MFEKVEDQGPHAVTSIWRQQTCYYKATSDSEGNVCAFLFSFFYLVLRMKYCLEILTGKMPVILSS